MPLARATRAVSALLDRVRTPERFAVIAWVTLVLLWVIIPSGAIVRLTGSGLGCPDWPTCDGGVVPETGGHATIEYTNRILSAIVIAACVLAWIVARRLPGAPRSLPRWSLLAALMGVVQGPLGAITVLSGLHPLAVGSHFLVSLIALSFGTLLFLAARDFRDGRHRGWDRRRGPMAALVALAGATLLCTGMVVTAAGPHSGDDDVTKRFGDLLLALQVHVRAAVTFLVLVAVLATWVWREGGVDRLTARLTAVAVPLVLLQIGIGEYQYRNGLPWQVVAVHVSVAGLAWAVVAAAAWGVARPVTGRDYRRREAARWQGTQRTASGSALSRPSGISSPQSTHTP
ncbi:MAG: heme A synthase [Thermoleophilia bacterium]